MAAEARAARASDLALGAAIVLAPVAGGSSHPVMVPVLGVLALISLGISLASRRRRDRPLRLLGLPLGLLVLAVLTALQLVPLPEPVLLALSPRAHELRSFVSDTPGLWPLSYEPGPTAREVAKLLIYATLVVSAHERARAGGFAVVARPLMAAGVATLAVAFVHRAVGAERVLGLLPAMEPAHHLRTTFVNGNHAAALLSLAALTAIGSAADEPRRERQVAFGAVAAICGAGVVLCFSRGGLLALGLGLAAYVALGLRRSRRTGAGGGPSVAWIALGVAAVAAAGLEWGEFSRGFASSDDDPLGVSGKLAAVSDAGPLIRDHLGFGIGRGSWVSVYSGYKTSPGQFTFTHPENLPVQLVSEWGVVVGPLALAGLVFAIGVRALGVRSAAARGALAALVGVLVQNLVDFSLELPGVAVPVCAILGAAQRRRAWALRWRVTLPRLVAALALLAATGGTASVLAWRGGEPLSDAARMLEPGADPEAIAARHPASAIAAARTAWALETRRPPELRGALRWANRALYLAPTYADAHLLTGRLLVRLGHRRQGFSAMREGWRLVEPARRAALVDAVVALASDPEEVALACPREDEALDVPDRGALALGALSLVAAGRTAEARTLVARIDGLEGVPVEALEPIASAAFAVGDAGRAEAAALARRAVDPDHGRALQILMELYRGQSRWAELDALLTAALARPGAPRARLLHAQADAALRTGDHDRADAAIAALRHAVPPTPTALAEVARLEARAAVARGRPERALSILDRAVERHPGQLDLRLERARLLFAAGRPAAAREDLRRVVAGRPQDGESAELLRRAEAAAAQP